MIKYLLGLVIFSVNLSLQAQTPDTVTAGPYGVPRLVKTEGGQWSEPIKVYSNADEVVYVPDITRPGWAQWHVRDFQEYGMYFTYVYTYLRKQRATVQDTAYVNLNTQHVTVVRFLKPPQQINLRSCTPAVSQTIANITKIVRDSIDNFHGPTISDTLNNQKYAVAKMAACVNNDPDCDLSDADFAKKYPSYPRTNP